MEVTILLEDNLLTLTVRDNGLGLPEVTKHTTFGLRGMKERIEMLSGEFMVHSHPNEGTELTARIPLPNSQEEER